MADRPDPSRGEATLRDPGPRGMITLRAAPDAPGLAAALGARPALRGIVGSGDRLVAWMAPDEYLLIRPPSEVGQTLAHLADALRGSHHLAVDVSDARVMLRLEGAGADAVLARLCPVDFARFPVNEMRRTRLGQVACALWREGEGVNLVVFRSVARYAADLVRTVLR